MEDDLTAQLNPTPSKLEWQGFWSVIHPAHPTPPDKLLDQFQGTQEADFRCATLIQPN